MLTHRCGLCQKIYNDEELPQDPSARSQFRCVNCKGTIISKEIDDSLPPDLMQSSQGTTPSTNSQASGAESFFGMIFLVAIIAGAIYLISMLFGIDLNDSDRTNRFPIRFPRRP